MMSKTKRLILIRKALETIETEQLIEPGDKILIGISGGIDSSVLLHFLVHLKDRLQITLGIGHVNYQLRADESQRDEDFVSSLGRQYKLPVHLTRVDTRERARESGKSIQHAGRDLRYTFFAETAQREAYTKIAIGHTKDDQVETFLMRMTKGTGTRGLSAIPVQRGMIIRPFLDISRAEIVEYAKTKRIDFVVDSSNATTQYERNFIRHRLIPVLEELNPEAKEKIFSLSKDMREVNHYFENKAREFYSAQVLRVEDDGLVVPAIALGTLDTETLYRVLILILGEVSPEFIPSREHVRLIRGLFSRGRPNAWISLSYGATVKRVYDLLVFTVSGMARPLGDVIPVVPGENRLSTFGLSLSVSVKKRDEVSVDADRNAGFFDNDLIGDLKMRTFRNGDRFHPLGMKGSMKVKDFFITAKIPREGRCRVPILLNGEEILWVVGHRIDDRYKVTSRTNSVLVAKASFGEDRAPSGC